MEAGEVVPKTGHSNVVTRLLPGQSAHPFHCEVDPSVFEPPADYTTLGPGRSEPMRDEDDNLLQFAIQQSLLDAGTESDQVRVKLILPFFFFIFLVIFYSFTPLSFIGSFITYFTKLGLFVPDVKANFWLFLFSLFIPKPLNI